MNKITIDRLITDSKDFNIERKSDHISYNEFIKYFSDINKITKHSLIIGINFTYGWMPTILKLRNEHFEENVEILNRVKKGETINSNDYESLKSLFNNSLVGTSKLLHFINPEQYPIWDSRVLRYCYPQNADNSIGKIDNYLQYIELCHKLTQDERFNYIHQEVQTKLGYNITKLRAIELIFFYKGKKESQKSHK